MRFLHPDLGSSFWGMVFILSSTNLLTARIAAGCFAVALVVVLFVAKNVSSNDSELIFCLPIFFHVLYRTSRVYVMFL